MLPSPPRAPLPRAGPPLRTSPGPGHEWAPRPSRCHLSPEDTAARVRVVLVLRRSSCFPAGHARSGDRSVHEGDVGGRREKSDVTCWKEALFLPHGDARRHATHRSVSGVTVTLPPGGAPGPAEPRPHPVKAAENTIPVSPPTAQGLRGDRCPRTTGSRTASQGTVPPPARWTAANAPSGFGTRETGRRALCPPRERHRPAGSDTPSPVPVRPSTSGVAPQLEPLDRRRPAARPPGPASLDPSHGPGARGPRLRHRHSSDGTAPCGEQLPRQGAVTRRRGHQSAPPN